VGVLTTERDIDQFDKQKSATSKLMAVHYKSNAFVVQLVSRHGAVFVYVIDVQPVHPKRFHGIGIAKVTLPSA
jgi:hypothetical protein